MCDFIMKFNDIMGQKKVVESLKKAVEKKRIGHAYIFSGQSGIGKTTVAKLFAALLLCTRPFDGESCKACRACKLFTNGSNPDFFMIEPDNNSIKIEQIRDMQDEIIVKPMYSKRKVYIIEKAETMTVQAQNCLLKTLEEPPPFAVIILTTGNVYYLKETIRSRSIKYNFKKNSINEIKTFLKQKYNYRNENIDFIASYADGTIGKALKLAGSNEFNVLRESVIETINNLKAYRLLDVFEIYKFFESNRENINVILDIMTLYYRDLLIVKKTNSNDMLINADKKDIILNGAEKYSVRKLVNNIQIIESARRNIKFNANYQLAIEVMLIKIQEGVNSGKSSRCPV